MNLAYIVTSDAKLVRRDEPGVRLSVTTKVRSNGNYPILSTLEIYESLGALEFAIHDNTGTRRVAGIRISYMKALYILLWLARWVRGNKP